MRSPWIRNHNKARQNEAVGAELAFFTAELCLLCHQCGIFWSIENPRSSKLWSFPPIFSFSLLEGVFVVDFPMCAYGAPHKKNTSIMTNMKALTSLAARCVHVKHEAVLAGSVKTFNADGGPAFASATKLAGAYPDRLCRAWCRALKRVCPSSGRCSTVAGDYGELFVEKLKAARRATPASQHGRPDAADPHVSSFEKAVPSFLDSITFGQHTKAEQETRRVRRAKRKSAWHAFRQQQYCCEP